MTTKYESFDLGVLGGAISSSNTSFDQHYKPSSATVNFTDTARSGLAAAFNKNGVADNLWLGWSTPWTDLYVSFWFQIVQTPALYCKVATVIDSGANEIAGVAIQADGKLAVRKNNQQVANSGTNLVASNTWYKVNINADNSGNIAVYWYDSNEQIIWEYVVVSGYEQSPWGTLQWAGDDWASPVQTELYPSSSLYPSNNLYPSSNQAPLIIDSVQVGDVNNQLTNTVVIIDDAGVSDTSFDDITGPVHGFIGVAGSSNMSVDGVAETQIVTGSVTMSGFGNQTTQGGSIVIQAAGYGYMTTTIDPAYYGTLNMSSAANMSVTGEASLDLADPYRLVVLSS